MRVNSTTSDKAVSEIIRRQNIFNNFMESFNTGNALPPVMANIRRRVESLEETVNGMNKNKESSVVPVKEEPTVDSLIETVEEPVNACPHREKIERAIREMENKITKLNGIIDGKDKEITKLNSAIVQLNKTIEELVLRVHSIETIERSDKPVSTEAIDTTGFATKKELKDSEKRIIKDLTDKIDTEIINAEERFDEKIKASMDTIKAALDETIGGDEEEEDEEEDIDGVIDMD